MDLRRAVDAMLFHTRLIREHQPYACGPLPERDIEHLALAAARTCNPAPILESDTDPETKLLALRMTLGTMWAAGFKAGAQAAGPADGA